MNLKKNKLILVTVIVFTFICCNSNKQLKLTSQNNNEQSIQNKYSEILNVKPINIQNVKLYQFIDQWMGVKYKYGGISKDGVDCSGFCNILYQEVYQKTLPRTSVDIAKELRKVSKDNLKEGDILLFDIEGKKNAHVGIYLQNNKFIHASTSSGVIVSSLDNPYYQKAYNKGGKV